MPPVVQRKKSLWDQKPKGLLGHLLTLPVEEARAVIAVTSDRELLPKLRDALDAKFLAPTPAGADGLLTKAKQFAQWFTLRGAINGRIATLEKVDEIMALAKGKGQGLTPDQVNAIQEALEGLHAPQLKQLEKEIVLWPSHIPPKKREQLTDVVTGPLRLSDIEEAERGRFAPEEGAAVKDALAKARAGMKNDVSRCMQFLYIATGMLHGDADAVARAKHRYELGVEERTRGLHSGGTGSRLSEELRLEGLLGPVHRLPWKGTPEKGRHQDPTPKELFIALSSAGPGWYFFYVAMFGHHSRLVAVEVKDDGSRKFTLMEHLVLVSGAKPGQRDITTKVNKTFDDFGRPDKFSVNGSKVWQVYVRPHIH